MNQKGPEILIISGTLGLGHVTRDLEIAKEIRKEIPHVKISWIAAPPASNYLIENNETLLPESECWPSETEIAEKTSVGSNMNVAYYFVNASETWDKQWEIFKKVVKKYSFNLIIGDETYRIATNLTDAALNNQPIIQTPFVIIYDFVGAKTMTNDPKEKEVVDYMNNLWQIRISSKFPKEIPQNLITRFFVGDVDDVENRETDSGVIDFQNMVKGSMTFLGNIIRFDPEEYRDKSYFREKLNYSSNPLIVCNVGGSNIGSELLQLCGASYEILEKTLPGLQMVLVCGPRIDPDTLELSKGVRVHGYMPDLIEHFAACDLAIIQPGLSTVNELVALQKPFIYFPIPGHFEQSDISNRLKRRQVGIEMLLEETTPELLGDAILSSLGLEVKYPVMNFQGARVAATHVKKILSTLSFP